MITFSIIINIDMQKDGLKALVFGSTGAIGAQLVANLLASPTWSSVQCVARKGLEEWNNIPGKQKLKVQTFQNLDDYFKQENNKYAGVDSVFCCFGSQVKHGDETFIKVDKTYPLLAADIALRNKIPQYLLVSSMGSDAKSWFLYPRTKGQVEAELKLKKMNLLSIFRPGLIKNRRDARTGEKIFGICPFLPKIEATEVANVLRLVAERNHQKAQMAKESVEQFSNSDMLQVIGK